MTNKKIRVFLSRPNPFTNEQQYFIDKLKSTLENYNIESITLQAKDYSPYESLSALNEMIKRCYGMVILASTVLIGKNPVIFVLNSGLCSHTPSD